MGNRSGRVSQDPSQVYVTLVRGGKRGGGGGYDVDEKAGEEEDDVFGRALHPGGVRDETDVFPFTLPFTTQSPDVRVIDTVLDVIVCARTVETNGRLRIFATPRSAYVQYSTLYRDASPAGPYLLCSETRRAMVRDAVRATGVRVQSLEEAATIVAAAPFVAIVRRTCRGDITWLEVRLSDVPYYAYVPYYHLCRDALGREEPRKQQLLMKLVTDYTLGSPGTRLLMAKYRYYFEKDNDTEYYRQNIYTKNFIVGPNTPRTLGSSESTDTTHITKHADKIHFVFIFPPAYY